MKIINKRIEVEYKDSLFCRIEYIDGDFKWLDNKNDSLYTQESVDEEEEYDLSPSIEEIEEIFQQTITNFFKQIKI